MMEGSNDTVEVDDDFLSLVEAAENKALMNKRRKSNIINERGERRRNEEEVINSSSSSEGAYTAALKGSKSNLWQQSDSLKKTRINSNVSDNGNTCFKCGKLGHWARDCNSNSNSSVGLGGMNENSSMVVVAEKMCSCGLGVCLVLTANTEKNRGRKFYRCPVREENGGCGFFEWCDNASATPMSNSAQHSTSSSSFPDLPCPCGAGSCLILTARTEKNMGQQFYRCPANQENACGFFKWCSDQTSSVGLQTNTSKVFSNLNDANNKSYGEVKGTSCFKCGQDGHWARDCPEASSTSSIDMGGRSSSSGICYKCGMSGHWARDCSKPSSSASSIEVAGRSTSSGTCYKCGKSGHWARDCPGQVQNVRKW